MPRTPGGKEKLLRAGTRYARRTAAITGRRGQRLAGLERLGGGRIDGGWRRRRLDHTGGFLRLLNLVVGLQIFLDDRALLVGIALLAHRLDRGVAFGNFRLNTLGVVNFIHHLRVAAVRADERD